MKQSLACPSCHQTLLEKEELNLYHCQICQLDYPIIDGIPVLVIKEATKIQG